MWYGHDERLRVVAAVTAERPAFDSEWSRRLLVEDLSELGISASQVGSILAEFDMKPHQVLGWLTRKDDPSLRVADVCGAVPEPADKRHCARRPDQFGHAARAWTRKGLCRHDRPSTRPSGRDPVGRRQNSSSAAVMA